MYEHIHDAPEEFQLSPFEDGISNRQRRSLRPKSTAVRRQEARTATAQSGRRIRVWRKVLNEEDFADQLRIWHPAHQARTARRKNYRDFTMTVFDTKQQPLRHIEPYSQEELEEILEREHPVISRQIGPIAVMGAMRFGGQREPFIALSFRSPQLDAEQKIVRETIAPELRIDDSHQQIHRPHVSLGKITVANTEDRMRIADQIQAQLEPVLPKHVVLGPARVDLTFDA